MVKRLCISISDLEYEWIEQNKMSPSKLLQDEIKRVREIMQTSSEIIGELNMKITAREEHISKLNMRIMEMGEKIDVLEKEKLS